MQQIKVDNATVSIYENRIQMGQSAAEEAIAQIKKILNEQPEINIVFAAAPSQNEFLDTFSKADDVDWHRINAFHMDEYIGLPDNAPQRFGNYLKKHIFGKHPFKSVHYLRGNAPDIDRETIRYADLLMKNPVDIVLMGIGENGHIAFNDPPVADFNDPQWVKTVRLDHACRMQQVNDKCFATLDDVPQYAVTLTVPALFAGKYLFCMVPSRLKAPAVRDALTGEISEACPASILRRHKNARIYLDRDSFSLVDTEKISKYGEAS
ncbi:MAG: glucosamine-6-phosphate deaminase [Dysgonamonadaceae bacterium]|jgi:glucosamine-6-phosphate deaminase|nr:glucosamine-6-phosphate deaminase [Dysgonamonadaceae bacterium]